MKVQQIINTIIIVLICLYSLFFLVGAVFAPILAYLGQYEVSGKIYSIFLYACHHRPERTFWLLGYPMTICARCFGFYLGCILASFLKLKPAIYLFLLVFFVIDIILNFIFNINTGNIMRFLAGISLAFVFINLFRLLLFKEKKL